MNGFARWMARAGVLVLLSVGVSCGGSKPASTDISNLIVAGAPAGACLIEYNTALVAGDPCCLAVGGANSCDLSTQCNAASGAGCCLFYATNNTTMGEACCRYSGNSTPTSGDGRDITSDCNTLLAAGR